ncbi:MAG TPA: hypothetical protein VL754_04455 [Verrucomicrobiae bacterium]|jgi:pyroglutamyl-peptidase|nr:hypothetical protein [Verrucomicrobiae bacterium]
MRLLVYGFGTYKQFKSNITSKIVRKLPRSASLKKIVFPVRFNKAQFIAAIRKNNPGVILGLGQCSSGTKLRIERRAMNRRRNNKEEKGRAIRRGGPKSLKATLQINKATFDGAAEISSDAGDYVCNFLMYIGLDYLHRNYPEVRCGFIHIPHDYPFSRAFRLIRRAIREASRD